MVEFNISEKAQQVIKNKVAEFNSIRQSQITDNEMLEYMILEFDASTPEERHEQARNRVRALQTFLETTKAPSIEDAWRNGWSTGWNQFQSRKESCKHLKREE